MSCRMLFFDYRESEKSFFDKHIFQHYDIKFFQEPLNEDILGKLTDEDFEKTMIISVFITSDVNKQVIDKFKNLRVITTRSTGYDHIDIRACVDRNVALINIEAYGQTSVAQFVMALMLMLVRNIYLVLNSDIKSVYKLNNFTGRNLENLTLGVIGTGEIGAGVCRLANCLGMRILAYDIVKKNILQRDYGVEYLEFDDVLKIADIVTLHLPYSLENYQMFSDAQFKMMKEGSYFINVSRGNLVDTGALLKYLKLGKFRGVALDVLGCVEDKLSGDFINEDLYCVENSKQVQELMTLPNVIVTPHMAYNTQDSIDLILEKTFKYLSEYFNGSRDNRVV